MSDAEEGKLRMDHTKTAAVFKAFCDENRLRILEQLRAGETCVCVLSERLDMRQSALSYHMKILLASGIVSARVAGKWTHYSLSSAGTEAAQTLLSTLTTPNAEQMPALCCDE